MALRDLLKEKQGLLDTMSDVWGWASRFYVKQLSLILKH